MKRWTVYLPDEWDLHCWADGEGVVLSPDGEEFLINDHDHAQLFVIAHRCGFVSDDRDEEDDHGR